MTYKQGAALAVFSRGASAAFDTEGRFLVSGFWPFEKRGPCLVTGSSVNRELELC